MKNINKIVIKNNDETTICDFSILTDTQPYITKNEECFQSIIDNTDFENISKEEILKIKEIAKTITMSLNTNTLNNLIMKLKRVTNKNELINGFQNTLKLNFDEVDEKYNKDLIISILIKNIVNHYYEIKVLNLSVDLEKLNSLEFKNLNGLEKSELFTLIGEDMPDEAFNNGMFTLCYNSLNDNLNKVFLSRQKHLCSDCPREVFYSCPKISDRLFQGKYGYKENINFPKIQEYSFVENGVEIIDSNGTLDSLTISKCKRIKKSNF